MTNLFSTTAQPAKYWGDNGVLHSVTHQGAGMINVWNAYNSGVKFESGALVVGGTTEPRTHNITFTNTLGRSKTFSISHQPAGLMQRTPYADLDPVGWYVYGFPSKPIYAEVDFDTPTAITLGPGETAEVSFTVTPPSGIDPDAIPIYSGFIHLQSGRDVYNVPYMGLPYTMNEVPLLERDLVTDHLLPAMVLNTATEIDFVDTDLVIYDRRDGDYPTMAYFARQPSEAYRLDLIAANTTFEPTYYGFNTSNILDTSTPDLPVVDNFGGAESFGIIFLQYYLEPVYHYLSWGGWLDGPDGAYYGAKAGDYRWLLRVLPIEKDPNDADNWESWLGPVMRIPVDYE